MASTIIHLDMDAFYASVEQQDRPDLRGRPVIVGGTPERGVVCACSYEARRFGVRSAMAMARAVRLCPASVVLPVRMERYREVSTRVFAIFSRYTDRVEPLSIDEAFLDVGGCERLYGSALEIAARIRKEVRQETGLAVSAGIAPNKFLAKIASERAKPDGLLQIEPEGVDDFLLPLPVSALWGVGPKTAGRLEAHGLRTVADLRSAPREWLTRRLGATGDLLHRLSRGEDDRPVEASEGLQSVGHEDTYGRDLTDRETIRLELLNLAERVARRLRRKGVAGRRVTLKVKYADFETVSRSRTLSRGVDNALEIHREALAMLGRTEAGLRPVRLLGISLAMLGPRGEGQLDLFGGERSGRMVSLDRAMDRLRDRFGEGGVRRGSLLEKKGGRSGSQEGGDGAQGA